MWNLKHGTNEPIYNTELDSQTEIRLIVGERTGERSAPGIWGWQIQTITYRMDEQQGLTVLHRELYPVFQDKP